MFVNTSHGTGDVTVHMQRGWVSSDAHADKRKATHVDKLAFRIAASWQLHTSSIHGKTAADGVFLVAQRALANNRTAVNTGECCHDTDPIAKMTGGNLAVLQNLSPFLTAAAS